MPDRTSDQSPAPQPTRDPVSIPQTPPEKHVSTPDPSATPEVPIAMLDVHPPHTSVHGWRDFFIHIATIVIGLCIAVGIEQTVEWVHHHHQIAETREALHVEREQNRGRFSLAVPEFRRMDSALRHNLSSFQELQQHPGLSLAKLPPIMSWRGLVTGFDDQAWQAAHQSGVTALMPQSEVRSDGQLYNYGQGISTAALGLQNALYDARRYTFRDPDPTHLTTAQLAQEIDFISTALTKNYALGSALRNLAYRYPDFSPAPTLEELLRMSHEPDPEAAKKLVEDRMKDLKAAEDAQPDASSANPENK